MKKVSKFSSSLILCALTLSQLSFAAKPKVSEACEPAFSKVALTIENGATSEELKKISASFFTELAGSEAQGKALKNEVILKLRKKIHAKKSMLLWIDIVQSISSIKRGYEKPLSQLKSAQVKALRLALLHEAMLVPDIRQEFMTKLSTDLFKEFKATFKRPNLKATLKKMSTTPEEMAIIFAINAQDEYTSAEVLEHFVFNEMRSIKEEEFKKLRQSLMVAYRTRASKYRRTLTLQQFYYGVLEKYPSLRDTDFNLNDLSYLIGDGFVDSFTNEEGKVVRVKGAVKHPMPFELSLFNGLEDLYTATRKMFPSQFERVIDLYKFDAQHHQKIIKAFFDHKRMIFTWAAPRVPVDKAMFDAMIKYAEEQDAFVVVLPEAGQPMELDPILYNHPKIFIAIDSIEFSPWLRLNAIPLPGKRQDPISPARQSGRGGERGVINIIGHPQMRDEIIPTGDNDIHQHRIVTTGAITKAWYNGKFIISGVTDQSAREVHKNGFIVVDKDKLKSGFDGMGTPNTPHVRHIDFIQETASLIDVSQRFTVKGKTNVRPLAFAPGDDHVGKEHREFGRFKIELIKRLRPKYYISNDLVDGDSISHWDLMNPIKLVEKLKEGRLDLVVEITKVISFVNAVLAADPEIIFVVMDSNHNDWLMRVLQEMHKHNLPMNHPIIAEMWNAWHQKGISPLQYLLLERPQEILRDPTRAMLADNIPMVIDPSRLSFPGPEGMRLGPEHRRMTLVHGHNAGGPSKAGLSTRLSAGRAYGRVGKGHSHGPGRNADVFDFGMSTIKGDYMKGPNGVGLAFGLIYEEGIAQLHHFNDKSLTFALEDDEVAPNSSYRYKSSDGVVYPRVIELEEKDLNLDTLDQWRASFGD